MQNELSSDNNMQSTATARTAWDPDLCKIPSQKEFNTKEKQQN